MPVGVWARERENATRFCDLAQPHLGSIRLVTEYDDAVVGVIALMSAYVRESEVRESLLQLVSRHELVAVIVAEDVPPRGTEQPGPTDWSFIEV